MLASSRSFGERFRSVRISFSRAATAGARGLPRSFAAAFSRASGVRHFLRFSLSDRTPSGDTFFFFPLSDLLSLARVSSDGILPIPASDNFLRVSSEITRGRSAICRILSLVASVCFRPKVFPALGARLYRVILHGPNNSSIQNCSRANRSSPFTTISSRPNLKAFSPYLVHARCRYDEP